MGSSIAKKIRTLGLSALITLPGIANASFNRDMHEISDLCAVKTEVPNLYVNERILLRTYANKTEQEGVRDIIKLVYTSKHEEAWAYLPEKEKWIELGFSSKINYYDGFLILLSLNEATVSRLVKENNNMIIYHFHPTNIDLTIDYMQSKNIVPNFSNLEKIVNLYLRGPEIAAIPSYPDMAQMFKKSRDFYKTNPEGEMIHKIVSSYGVTSYYLTEQGKIFFSDKCDFNCNQNAYSYGKSLKNSFFLDLEIPSYEKIRKLCNFLSSQNFNIEFETFKEFFGD